MIRRRCYQNLSCDFMVYKVKPCLTALALELWFYVLVLEVRQIADNKVRKKENIRNRHNQIPHPAQDTIWERNKYTRKHHAQESQEVSPFQAGDHKAARNRHDSMADMKHK